MTERYEPPFSMTENMMNMVIEIGELTGQITAHNQLSTNPRLRRENRIKTIHSSLAIEDNTLSLGQVTAVIEGKKGIGTAAGYTGSQKMLMKLMRDYRIWTRTP